jgi:hypothetical protein
MKHTFILRYPLSYIILFYNIYINNNNNIKKMLFIYNIIPILFKINKLILF